MTVNGFSSIRPTPKVFSRFVENAMLAPVLSVSDLTVEFGHGQTAFRAVDQLSFDLHANKTLAIVGESGSGKSISSLAIMGLVHHLGGRITSGDIFFKSDHYGRLINLTARTDKQMRDIRGNEIAMIFQEPMTSLNPVFTVGSQIIETLVLHQSTTVQNARSQALELLDLVRLPNAKRVLASYPHQLSGGQRQRVMIAIALSCRPNILIADEPTTALDVTIQAQILSIIRDLQTELKTAVIFISHDMGVVSEMADDVLIMRASKKIEQGTARKIFKQPTAFYTKTLLAAVPKIGSMKGTDKPDFFHVPEEPDKLTPLNPLVSVPDYKKPLLQVKDLKTRYPVRGGLLNRVTHNIHAVENVSLEIYPGETLALVGESGSGKSTIGKTLQQLIKPLSGSVYFQGQDMMNLARSVRKSFIRNIQYVFQDPYGSLNPRKTIGTSIIEPALTHGLIRNKSEIRNRVEDLLVKVGLEKDQASRYPHEFSGGQRQRICIARALSCDPSLIIADEAVSALDVSVQAQVINLLMRLQSETGLSYLFITHDMAVVERIAHRVAVMYLGQIVEMGSRRQVFENPQHPYTKKLLEAVPVVDPDQKRKAPPMNGEIPSVMKPAGFEPPIVVLQEVRNGHFVAMDF